MDKLFNKFRGIPWGILINVYLIIGFGLYNLYSATNASVTPERFNTQLNWLLLGTGIMFFIGIIFDVHLLEKLSLPSYLILCLFLLGVDLFGKIVNGSQRWLEIGPIKIQPSEMIKFVIILMIARSFAYTKGQVEFSLTNLWRQFLFILIPVALILKQPDLGTASLVAMIAACQLFFVRIYWKSLIPSLVIGLVSLFLGWNFALHDYQKQRVLNFLNPLNDQQGSSYQSLQSMIAVGSGGMWGKGFLKGTQAQLSFLPERHTDFIFSVWSEEHGFIGSVILLILFSLFLVQLLLIVEKNKDIYSFLIGVGVFGFFVTHLFINVAMVIGLFPVVGVPLTLISYGGSNMLTALACLGLIISIERKRFMLQQNTGYN